MKYGYNNITGYRKKTLSLPVIEFISIEVNDPATAPDLSLSITVVLGEITVQVASDGAGNPISTAKDVADALNADNAANKLISTAYDGDGNGIVWSVPYTVIETSFSYGSGNSKLTFTLI